MSRCESYSDIYSCDMTGNNDGTCNFLQRTYSESCIQSSFVEPNCLFEPHYFAHSVCCFLFICWWGNLSSFTVSFLNVKTFKICSQSLNFNTPTMGCFIIHWYFTCVQILLLSGVAEFNAYRWKFDYNFVYKGLFSIVIITVLTKWTSDVQLTVHTFSHYILIQTVLFLLVGLSSDAGKKFMDITCTSSQVDCRHEFMSQITGISLFTMWIYILQTTRYVTWGGVSFLKISNCIY